MATTDYIKLKSTTEIKSVAGKTDRKANLPAGLLRFGESSLFPREHWSRSWELIPRLFSTYHIRANGALFLSHKGAKSILNLARQISYSIVSVLRLEIKCIRERSWGGILVFCIFFFMITNGYDRGAHLCDFRLLRAYFYGRAKCKHFISVYWDDHLHSVDCKWVQLTKKVPVIHRISCCAFCRPLLYKSLWNRKGKQTRGY